MDINHQFTIEKQARYHIVSINIHETMTGRR